MCLNIDCPPSSYDINIEPAKDDVLFTDEDAVLTICESFFNAYYVETSITGPSPGNSGLSLNGGSAHTGQTEQLPAPETTIPTLRALDSEFQNGEQDVLGRDEKMQPLTSRQNNQPSHHIVEVHPIETASGCQPLMYDDEDGGVPHGLSQISEMDATIESGSPELANPWTIAKINANLKSRQPHVGSQRMAQIARPLVQPLTPRTEARRAIPVQLNSSPIRAPLNRRYRLQYLPSPVATSPLHGSTRARRPHRPNGYVDQLLHQSESSELGETISISVAGTPLEEIPRAAQTSKWTPRSRPFVAPTKKASPQQMDRNEHQASQASSGQNLVAGPVRNISFGCEASQGIIRGSSADIVEPLLEAQLAHNLFRWFLYGSVDVTSIKSMSKILHRYDAYVRDGKQSPGLARPDSKQWELKLRSLFSSSHLLENMNFEQSVKDHLAKL